MQRVYTRITPDDKGNHDAGGRLFASRAGSFIDSTVTPPYAPDHDDRAGQPARLYCGKLLPGPPSGSGFAKIGLKL